MYFYKKSTAIFHALLFALLLSSCTQAPGIGQNIEELLRAPQLSSVQNAVQAELNAHLGKTLQLKYPRSGIYSQPILFNDFNEDGVQEAVVLYVTENTGKNVQLALLEQQEDKWNVVQQLEGLGTEVVQMELIKLTEKGSQILVGYSNAKLTEKYLVVYSYDGSQMSVMGTYAYEAYLVQDLMNKGTAQLFLAEPMISPDAITLQILQETNQTLQTTQTQLLDHRFIHATEILPTRYGQEYGIVIQGELSTGETANDLFLVKSGGLMRNTSSLQGQIVTQSARNVPVPAFYQPKQKTAYIPALVQTEVEHGFFIEWNHYLAKNPLQRYSFYDAKSHINIRLPLRWHGKITVNYNAKKNIWNIVDKKTKQKLVSLQILGHDAKVQPENLLNTNAEYQVIADFSKQCSMADQELIRQGVTFY